MLVEWDENKAHINLLKHGLSFEQAIIVFDDPFARVEEDHKHSTLEEKREIIIGETEAGLLVVIFTIRLPGPVRRIISARKANNKERSFYGENKRIQLRKFETGNV